MFKKSAFFALLLAGGALFAQNTLDLARLNLGRATLDDASESQETSVTNINAEFLYPTPLSSKVVLITGLTVEHTGLDFAADNAESVGLTMTRINAGAKIKHSRRWTGTYMLLPKLATDFEALDGDAIQFGGLALLEKKLSSRKTMRFGVYSSSENFGAIITPLMGYYYRTKNRKFYVDAVLPIRAEANYSLNRQWSLGVDLRTSIKSYFLADIQDQYVQEESIRAGLYASYGLMKNQILIRAKVGYDTTDYGLYNSGDTVGAQVLTFQVSGDDRNRLNAEYDASLFFGLDFIYRVKL